MKIEHTITSPTICIVFFCIGRYSNGDVYEGYLKDDLPHGHGTLKRGHFLTSAAHVYVGQWENGQKHGYGVMDDVTAGQLVSTHLLSDFIARPSDVRWCVGLSMDC